MKQNGDRQGWWNTHVYMSINSSDGDRLYGCLMECNNILIDRTPPVITVSEVNCSYRNSPLSLKITLTDNSTVLGGSISSTGKFSYTQSYAGSSTTISSENSLQYYVSDSSASINTGNWTGDTWTTYTNGTAFNLNPGVSGKYYMMVKRVKDAHGNEAIANGYSVTTGSDLGFVQEFRTYKFDYDKPTAGTLKMGTTSGGSDYTSGNWTNKTIYVAINSQGSDSHSGVASTKYTIKKGSTTVASNQTGSYTLSDEGEYTITLTTTDKVGNYSTRTYYVKIDKTAPTVTIENTCNGASYSGSWTNQNITSKLTFSDASSGINASTLEWREKPSGGSWTSWTGLSNTSTTTYSDTWSAERNSVGQYRIRDIAGNYGNTVEFDVKIDKTAPSSLTYTTSYSDGTGTYNSGDWYNASKGTVQTTISAGDSLSGIDKIYYKNVSEGSWNQFQFGVSNLTQSGTIWTGTEEWSTEGSDNITGGRNNSYDFKTVDKAGNEYEMSGTPDWIIRYDLTNPTAGTMTFKNADGTTYTPGDDSWTNQDVTLTLVNGTDDSGNFKSGHKETTYSVTKDGAAYTVSGSKLTAEGKYVITITTTDNAGNTATRTYKVNIDKTKPSKVATMTLKNADGTTYTPGDNSWTKQNVNLTLNSDATDALSGVKTTTYTINGTASTATSITTEGSHTIVITTTDKAENKDTRTYTVNIDKTNPYWEIGTPNISKANKNVTVDIIGTDDLSGYKANTLDISDIEVWVDGVKATNITKVLSSATSVTEGIKYTLTLSNFEEATKQAGKSYKEWSGSTKIVIAANTLEDKAGNKNTSDEFALGHVDFIKPELLYQYTESSQAVAGDIDYEGKTFTMVFDVMDKYINASTLSIDDLTIWIDGKIPGDDDGDGIINGTETLKIITMPSTVAEQNANKDKVWKTLTVEDIESDTEINKTVGGVIVNDTHVIGKRFTLVLSNLEQLQIKSGEQYLDYSGVITVSVPGGKVTDTEEHGNEQTTITSGVDIPGGVVGDAEVVDVVDPLWQKVSSSALAKQPTDAVDANATTGTATLTIKGTDKYYASSDLTGKIKVYTHANGAAAGTYTDVTSSVNIQIGETVTPIYKVGTTDVQVGAEYTITITEWKQDINQLKVKILEDAMLDTSGNGNKETDFIVYNVLRLTNTETAQTSQFLNSTTLERQNIENITFLSSTSTVPETGWWDVSAAGDNSIKAWATQTETQATKGVYTVNIASDNEIFANQNSSYLFSYIGHSANSTATETITNLNLLNVKSVINMSNMFQYCGYTAMTSFTLPSTFDTSNVTDMSGMFSSCGHTAMIGFTLPSTFNTSNVTNMKSMFNRCGYTALISLNLGSEFDTSNVENMREMFNRCGFTAMTSLNLGSNFDTSKVTDMRSMFSNCGYTLMTSLDLGDKFSTASLVNMAYMFLNCGNKEMTTLDLGPMFTKIPSGTITDAENGDSIDAKAGCFNSTGKSGCVIFAPESIYSSKTAFKPNSTDTSTTISYTRGTINPVYRPDWSKVSSTLDEDAGTMTVVVKGTANRTFTNGTYTGTYVSDVISTLTSSGVTVYVDGELATGIDASDITIGTATTSTNATTNKTEVQQTITISNFEQAARFAGKNFKEWSGNVEIQLARGTLKDKYGSSVDGEGNVTKGLAGNSNLAVIDTSGTAENILIKDVGTLTANTDTTEAQMFADFIKPEFTYEYANTTIVGGNTETVTVVFDVTDKYFAGIDSTKLNASKITVAVDDYNVTEINNYLNTNNHKQLTKLKDVYYDATAGITYVDSGTEGTGRKVGERYQLVISGLDQGDAFKYSGYMSLAFAAGVITDKSGNTSDATSITIGKDDIDGNPGQDTVGNGVVVDVVDPIWELGTVDLSAGTIKLKTKDKYFNSSTIDEDDITVYINGIPSTTVEKDITSVTPTDIKETVNGVANTVVGKEYTLQLSNLVPEGGGYTEFTPTNLTTDSLNNTAGFKYKSENAGEVSLQIAAGVTTDKFGNGNNVTDLDVGNIDLTMPEVYEVQKIQKYPGVDADGDGNVDSDANTETIIFNVTDRNYDSSDLIGIDTNSDGVIDDINGEITLWIDDVLVDSLIDNATLTYKPINASIDNTTKTLGHQYTLVISNIAETLRQTGKDYLEWSGTLKITIKAEAAKDLKGNTLNTSTTTITDFVDYIKPDFVYQYTDSSQAVAGDIDYEGKTFTMVFDIMDKYVDASTLTIDDLTIMIDGEIPGDDNGDGIINGTETLKIIQRPSTVAEQNANKDKVWKTLTVEDIEAETEINKTIEGVVVNDTHVIGKRFTLVLSNLEQLQIKDGEQYLDYSGVITVGIPEGKVTDTKGNGNPQTTITSGIDIPGGVAGDSEIVDVVDPLWQKDSITVDAVAKQAVIKIKGTDKFYASTVADLESKLTIWAQTGTTGADATNITNATGVDITVGTPEPIYKTGTTDVKVGEEYTITITGFASDVNQIKLDIAEDAMLDTSGNGNKATTFMVYNVLRLTDTEIDTSTTTTTASNREKMFLGEESIQRQNVQQVIFSNSISGSTGAGVQKVWDVSAAQDGSIKAWTSQTTAPYTVYIGSDSEIFANQNSTGLFSYIGYATVCTETQTIKNLELLNTESVTSMYRMFGGCGYRSMTTLDLSSLDTRNVTTMSGMFAFCGYNAMTTLNLGTKFDTSKVSTMNNMFHSTGYTAMTSLDLSSGTSATNTTQFNTSSVTAMNNMFKKTGYTAMTTLNLGTNFNTSNVTNMNSMFYQTGYTALTELDLSSGTPTSNTAQFNTSSVTNMSEMFYNCGHGTITENADGTTTVTGMTELNLGTNFNTSNVTNMNSMFYQTGYTSLTALDLSSGTATTNTTQFNTSSVTDMTFMFEGCGYNAMTTLKLGTNFNTSNVTTMEAMFKSTGRISLTALDLSSGTPVTNTTQFNTSSVTNMKEMFYYCGYGLATENADGSTTRTGMATLNLGNNFDTSNVTTMYQMFYSTGRMVLTNLDLGDKFDTSNVTAMYDMFRFCGQYQMRHLDLGPKFTQIASDTDVEAEHFIYNTGRSGSCKIYVPEAIYVSKNALKLNSTGTTISSEYTRGTIIPIYKPEWTKVSSALDTTTDPTNPTLTVTVKGSAYKNETINSDVTINYASDVTSTLVKEDITVFIDGVEVTSTTNPTVVANSGTTSTNATSGKTEVTHTIVLSNLEEATRQAGIPYKEWSGNISLKIGGRGKETSTYTANILKDSYGNQNMMETDQNGTNADGTWIDVKLADTEVTQNTANTMFADFIKPEFTYEAANTTKVGGDTETVTVVFDVTDKYFAGIDSTKLNASQITVAVDDYNVTEINNYLNTNNHKQLTKLKDVYYDATAGTTYVDSGTTGTGRKVGERYQLVISGLDQGDAYKYSGYMSLSFVAGAITDTSGNTSDATSITIGKDDVDGNPGQDTAGNGVVVDVVDPIWELGDVDLDAGTIKLRTKDKYFNSSTIDEDDITVFTNGIASTTIEKDITSVTPTDIKETVNGVENTVVGKEYTLQLSNIVPSGGGYTDFTPTNITTDSLNNTAGFKYRSENGGAISIQIAAGVTTDTSGNGNNVTDLDVGAIDLTEPEIYEVQKIQKYPGVDSDGDGNVDSDANTETIIFNVTDRNYDSSDLITKEEITLWIDDTQLDELINGATLTYKEIKAEVDNETKVLGHQYTLVISNIAETVKQEGKDYLEYSGTLKITIDHDAAKDLKGNTLNTETTTITDFVDYIKPNLQYIHSASDIDRINKKYTMTFDITDKYYYEPTAEELETDPKANQLKLNDLTILMQNGQYEREQDKDGNWQYKLDGEGNKIPLVYDLIELANAGKINITFNGAEKSATFRKTVDGELETTATSHVIGHTYTLTIENLEQLEIATGLTTLDYSGVITVNVSEDKVKDTSSNYNIENNITTGVDVKTDGTGDTTPDVIDVVDPIWTKVSSSARAKLSTDEVNATATTGTATITFRGTDTYYVADSVITADTIKVLVNNSEVTAGLTKTLDSTTVLTEERIVNGVNETGVQYGVEYTISISGFEQNANQVKIQIPKGAMIDQYGNDSEMTEFIVYNVLKLASEEGQTTRFLGESVATTIYPEGVVSVTPIQRQYIERVEFVNSTEGSNASGVQRVWDVSAQEDESIIAWTSQTAAPYTVYIGSDNEIFANQDSSNLFTYIGYDSSCDDTQTIVNLNLLNTSSVTSMSRMFSNCGYTAMTSLILPTTFDTSSVTNMSDMFNNCGHEAMTSLTLPETFDTSNVTNMSNMFNSCGYNAMTSLTLPETFDTSNVTDMSNMFNSCGYNVMTILDLSNITQFNTSNVIDMSFMFNKCGRNAMTTLKLGTSFDTTNVINMNSMFAECGYSAMETLDLGEKFDTSKVTDMGSMFSDCGNVKMTKLDLGEKFNTSKVTNMNKMFYSCGYTLMTSLDLGNLFYTTSVTDMGYMFNNCGNTAMTILDLGPAFTRIPNMLLDAEGNLTTNSAHTDMFTGCGTTNLVIYAPESIYANITAFKLNKTGF